MTDTTLKRRRFAVPLTEVAIMLAAVVGLAAGAGMTWHSGLPDFVGPGADQKLLALDLGAARDWSLASTYTYSMRFERNDQGRIEGYVVECQLKQAGPPVQLIRRQIAADVEVTCSRLIVEFMAGGKVPNAATFSISKSQPRERWTIEVDSPQGGILLRRA